MSLPESLSLSFPLFLSLYFFLFSLAVMLIACMELVASDDRLSSST